MPHSSLSIASALRLCQKVQDSNDKNCGEQSKITVDIVAVCLNVHLRQPYSEYGGTSPITKKPSGVEFLVADNSIPTSKCVKIKLWTSKAVDAVETRQIGKGSVIKFIGMSLPTNAIDYQKAFEDNSTGNLEIICDFCNSWDKIDMNLSCFMALTSGCGFSSVEDHIVATNSIKENHVELVLSLLSWYNKHKRHDSRSIFDVHDHSIMTVSFNSKEASR